MLGGSNERRSARSDERSFRGWLFYSTLRAALNVLEFIASVGSHEVYWTTHNLLCACQKTCVAEDVVKGCSEPSVASSRCRQDLLQEAREEAREEATEPEAGAWHCITGRLSHFIVDLRDSSCKKSATLWFERKNYYRFAGTSLHFWWKLQMLWRQWLAKICQKWRKKLSRMALLLNTQSSFKCAGIYCFCWISWSVLNDA